MRIIGGKYKHKRWDVPRTFKARPTTDFAKENLFNVLANVYVDFDSAPSALDLFAGTGSIGLELVSRGCASVVSVEKDFRHFQWLRQVAADLGDAAWRPVHGDAFQYLRRAGRDSFDIVFADPPYALPTLATLPQVVREAGVLRAGGLFILEHGRDHRFDDTPGFLERRVYGSVNLSLFRFPEETQTAERQS